MKHLPDGRDSRHYIIATALLLMALCPSETRGQDVNTNTQVPLKRGVVVDLYTRQPIADVAIWDEEKEIGRTDEKGQYVIRLHSDSLTFSHISYITLKLGKDELIDTIPMIEQNNELGNVYIKGDQHYEIHMPPVDPLSMQVMPQGLNVLPLIVKGLKALGIIPKRTKRQSRLQKAKTICDNY